MAVPKALRQMGWFVALWAAGVGTVLTLGYIIRLVLVPG